MKELYNQTQKIYVRVLWVLVIMTFVIELAFGFYFHISGSLLGEEFENYLKCSCFIPTLFAAGVTFAAYLTLESPNISGEVKRYATVFTLELVYASVILAHPTFTILWGMYTLPIIISAIMGDKKFIRLASELSYLLLFFSIGLQWNELGEVTVGMVVDSTIAVCFMALSIPLSHIILKFVDSNRMLIEKQIQNQISLGKKINVDAMTGLLNHTTFYDELDRQIKETDRTGESLCIAIVDIDDFKSVNDTYGHSRGDEVLLRLSEILKEVCAGYEVCRYGGEEFSVIFRNCSLKESVRIMEAALEKFRSFNFEWCDKSITFSCGVCKHYDIRINSEELFKQADKYLYKAKKSGKNRVISE